MLAPAPEVSAPDRLTNGSASARWPIRWVRLPPAISLRYSVVRSVRRRAVAADKSTCFHRSRRRRRREPAALRREGARDDVMTDLNEREVATTQNHPWGEAG